MKIGNIKTTKRTNIAKGKHVVGILRPNRYGVYKKYKPHIPVLRDNGKKGKNHKSYASLRLMYNLLGTYLTKKGGAFVLFDWKHLEIWDGDKIMVTAGYIHTGNKEEGFRQIRPDEYCRLKTTLARKTVSATMIEGGQEDLEDLGEGIIDEDLEGTSWNESSENIGEGEDVGPGVLGKNNAKVSSFKLLKILDALKFQCKENGEYNIYNIYRRMYSFLVSRNLLLLSSLSAARIADDKWNTFVALDNIRRRWYERKSIAKPRMYNESYTSHYYLPHTVLGSEAVKDPYLLNEMERRVLDKFGENKQWLENPKKFVVKPRRGSLGKGITFHETKEECLRKLRSRGKGAINYLVQEYILLKNAEGKVFDYRVLVSGGKPVLAYKRVAADPKKLTANMSQGGISEPLIPKERKEIDTVSKYVIRHLQTANLRFAGLYEMVREFKEKHPGYRRNEDQRKIVEELWQKCKLLYRSSWEWFGYDVSRAFWHGKWHYILIEVNISPGVQGPYQLKQMDVLMDRVAENLLGFCRKHNISKVLPSEYRKTYFPLDYSGKAISSPKTSNLPTILILADLSKKEKDNPIDRISRLDARRYLETSQYIDYATVVCADLDGLTIDKDRLYVKKGIIKNSTGAFVEQELSLPVDYILRKKYLNYKTLSMGAEEHKRWIQAGVINAETSWRFARNIARWFESRGGPTWLTQPIIDITKSKVATELAFRNLADKYGIHVRRPKTYTPQNFNEILEVVLRLKKNGFQGAVIKPSRSLRRKGILFISLQRDEDQLQSIIRENLSNEIRKEMAKGQKVIVQALVEHPFLINGKKANLRTIVTPIVTNDEVRNIQYVLSHTRAAGSKYVNDPENVASQLPQDNYDGNAMERYFLREYLLEHGELDYDALIESIRLEAYHALNAIFYRARKKHANLAFDIVGMDVLLEKDKKSGKIVPTIIEINSSGEIFRDKTTDDSYIMKQLAKHTFPHIAERAKAFKMKREGK